MSDESRLVASSAQKDSKKYKTVYKNISYSRCKNCENNKGTFWKINAKKATHLEKSKVILYEDVFLELLNFHYYIFLSFITLILQLKKNRIISTIIFSI